MLNCLTRSKILASCTLIGDLQQLGSLADNIDPEEKPDNEISYSTSLSHGSSEGISTSHASTVQTTTGRNSTLITSLARTSTGSISSSDPCGVVTATSPDAIVKREDHCDYSCATELPEAPTAGSSETISTRFRPCLFSVETHLLISNSLKGPLAFGARPIEDRDGDNNMQKRDIAGRYHLYNRAAAVVINHVNGCRFQTPAPSPGMKPAYPGGAWYLAVRSCGSVHDTTLTQQRTMTENRPGNLAVSLQTLSRYYKATSSAGKDCAPTITAIAAKAWSITNSNDLNQEVTTDHSCE